MAEKIRRQQMRKIYVTSHQFGWSNEMLHSFLMSVTGKEHISNLTKHEAIIFIDELMKILGQDSGYRADKKADDRLRSEGMVLGCTPAQCDKIRYLMEDAGWTEGRLQGYLEQYSAGRLEDLTRTLASNLTEYLKSEIRRNKIAQATSSPRNDNN